MKTPNYRVKIGIVGCGAIGSRMASTINRKFRNDCRITGLYDIDYHKAKDLEKHCRMKGVARSTLTSLINNSDVVIEAVNAENTRQIVKKALMAKKTVLCMSVGKLMNSLDLFKLARRNKCYMLLPSGAVAGIDAIKAASLANIKEITLTTRKPTVGFRNNAYLENKGIDMNKIKKETVIFDGNVKDAVKNFPQNINVAATLALASQMKPLLRVRIITSPYYKKNSHEIKMVGDFGRMITRTDNEVCPDNPKSSYLAVLSGLQTLKQFCTGILIGT